MRRGTLVWLIVGGVVALLALCAGVSVIAWRLIREGPSTTLTVQATRPDGGQPSPEALDRARSVLLNRLRAAGLDEPAVARDGAARLVLRVRGRVAQERLRELTVPGLLRFRAVRGQQPDTTAAGAPVSPSAGTGPLPTLAEVTAKLGAAYELASRATEPLGAEHEATLRPFGALSPDEIAVLPAAVQFAVPTIDCAKLAARRPDAAADPGGPVVACGEGTKYLLDAAKVGGGDVAGARAGIGPQTHGWYITLTFTGAGQTRWTDLTRELAPDQGQVAIVQDVTVLTAPAIQSVITGEAQVTGSFTADGAKKLAAQISGGELDLRLTAV